jgi:hypothetical protein
MTYPAPRRLELFPIAKPRPATPLPPPRTPRWRPAFALVLTAAGLLIGAVALHREAALQSCPLPVRHG